MWMNRIIWLFCAIGLGVLASFHGGNVTYMLFGGCLLIPVFMLLYLIFVWKTFTYYQVIGKKSLVKGKATPYELHIKNETGIPYVKVRVSFCDDRSRLLHLTGSESYALLPGEERILTSLLVPKCRGEYMAGAEKFLFTDPLGLFTITCAVHSRALITVWPRKVDWPYKRLIEEEQDNKITLEQREYQDERDICVREYAPGDPMKQIHWKASAKAGKWMVHQSIDKTKPMLGIYMDYSPVDEKMPEGMVEDAMLEYGISLADYCVKKEISCKIFSLQSPFLSQEIRNRNELEEYYQKTALLPFLATRDWRSMLEHGRNISHCFLMLHSVNEENVLALLQFAAVRQVVIFYFGEVPDLLKEKNLNIVAVSAFGEVGQDE